jgi:NAD-dependent dihydropyrimidine dehydrogenase PreA subunit
MMLNMNLDACTGCGVCVEMCPVGAMCLIAGKAVINTELCTACQTCIDVCPTGAIMVVVPPAQATRSPAGASPSQEQRAAPGGIALWTGIALALVEHRIVPRLADAFIVALERWLSRPKPAPTTTLWQNTLQDKVGRRPTYRHRRRNNRSA